MSGRRRVMGMRRALTALEVAVLSSQAAHGTHETHARILIDRQTAEDSIQMKAAVYDGSGDEHFDVISAMIKSVRGSDPDAAVYWMARMLDAGEDPRYIAPAAGDPGRARTSATPTRAAS